MGENISNTNLKKKLFSVPLPDGGAGAHPRFPIKDGSRHRTAPQTAVGVFS